MFAPIVKMIRGINLFDLTRLSTAVAITTGVALIPLRAIRVLVASGYLCGLTLLIQTAINIWQKSSYFEWNPSSLRATGWIMRAVVSKESSPQHQEREGKAEENAAKWPGAEAGATTEEME
ncbi:hypothetical protein OUZ56_028044 [Daphnia magna]|uniref:Uncharacterized protein n=1 Tax=Daphnia magna TaxID=35525 RepID=A0ABR0B2P0_9CRUS|nr:hypothetical protein OUZ56_028044 [Daphnia magna]